ncbi:TRAP transporter substrate-binding protein [Desulfovibrio sp. OttesenSCG-928-I05]|nr:TRAP transporter substrate-binding protein [Desulfovibrio sp. OttesenSCG-928-I05]
MLQKLAVFVLALSCLIGVPGVFEAAAAQKTIIKINASYNPKAQGDYPQVQQIIAFKEKMEARFPDRVDVRVYWDQRLGSTFDGAMNSLQNNVFHMHLYPLSSMSEFTAAAIPMTDLFLVPYPHRDIINAAMDGEVGAMITERMIKDTRVRPLCFWEIGFRHLLNNKKPITSLEDLKGMKFRVQPNPVHLTSFKALGTNPTPIPWAELFTALQQGVVDGTENPYENITAARLHEIQKYLTLSGHAFEMASYVMGEEFYQSLPDDIRTGIHEVMAECTTQYRLDAIKRDEEIYAFLKEKMEINELSPEVLEEFREAVKPAREIARQQSGAEYADKFYALMERYEAEYFARIK